MSQEIVNKIAHENPTLLVTNTGATCHAFTRLVIAELKRRGHTGWGHIGKTAGEGQFQPTGWTFPRARGSDGREYRLTGVSHDAIFNRDTNTQVDILGNANDGPEPFSSRAFPVWNVIPREHYRVNNPWISLDDEVTPIPTQTPTPTPSQSDVSQLLSVVEAQLATIREALDRLAESSRTVAGRVVGVADRQEVVVAQNDRIIRQLLSPPDYSARFIGTLKPTVKAVEP